MSSEEPWEQQIMADRWEADQQPRQPDTQKQPDDREPCKACGGNAGPGYDIYVCDRCEGTGDEPKSLAEPSFHQRMMNVQHPQNTVYKKGECEASKRLAYATGHKDARHACAEIAIEADTLRTQLAAAEQRVKEVEGELSEANHYVRLAADNMLKLTTERDELRRDAERWRALVGCQRIRILGSAGFSGEHGTYRHFGVEFWNEYPEPDAGTARDFLTEFVDGESQRAIDAALKARGE